jgi:hypothetical protein
MSLWGFDPVTVAGTHQWTLNDYLTDFDDEF